MNRDRKYSERSIPLALAARMLACEECQVTVVLDPQGMLVCSSCGLIRQNTDPSSFNDAQIIRKGCLGSLIGKWRPATAAAGAGYDPQAPERIAKILRLLRQHMLY